MASGKILRQIIKAGSAGDATAFRQASEAIIREERQKQHHFPANSPGHWPARRSGRPFPLCEGSAKEREMPSNKDNGLALLEERPVVREEKDIVLSNATQSLFTEILNEHNRADVLRSYGLQPAQKFCLRPARLRQDLQLKSSPTVCPCPWCSCGWIRSFHRSWVKRRPTCARSSTTSCNTLLLRYSMNLMRSPSRSR